MKIRSLAALGLLSLASLHAVAGEPIINISVGGEIAPGVYGRVDFGNAPPPPVLYPQPVIIAQPAQRVAMRPLYLHVPPGHAKNWGKHCQRYDACGRPVYFVKSSEYGGGEDRGPGKGNGKGHGKHGRDH